MKRTFWTLWNMLKRTLVLVVTLVTTAMVVATVCRAITGDIKLSVGTIILILGIGLLTWGLKSLSRHRLSFVRTFMVVLILGLFVLSSSVYLGIRSPSDVKDSITLALHSDSEQFHASVDAVVERAELKIVEIASASGDEGESKTNGTAADETTEEEKTEDTGNIYIGGGVLVGADGHWITLHNNPNAQNPTWEELKAFLAADKTDSHQYDLDTFVCGDFAEMLHNNAEAAGLRAAFVAIQLGPCPYYPASSGHALNAFETTDKGLVYIDCTSSHLLGGDFEEYQHESPLNYDKMAYVVAGKSYGLITLDKAMSPSYSFYENYMQDWEDYKRSLDEYTEMVDEYSKKVDEYEAMLGGRTIINNYNEYEKLKRMYDELEKEGVELEKISADLESQQEILGDYRWEPLSTVSEIEIIQW